MHETLSCHTPRAHVRSSAVLATFKAWADDNFGGIRSAFAVFDGALVLLSSGGRLGAAMVEKWWKRLDFIKNNEDNIYIYTYVCV